MSHRLNFLSAVVKLMKLVGINLKKGNYSEPTLKRSQPYH